MLVSVFTLFIFLIFNISIRATKLCICSDINIPTLYKSEPNAKIGWKTDLFSRQSTI